MEDLGGSSGIVFSDDSVTGKRYALRALFKDAINDGHEARCTTGDIAM